jgi:hypothetical protein
MPRQAVHVDDELHSIVLLDGMEAIEFPEDKDNAVAVMKSGERRDLANEDFCLLLDQVRAMSAHAKYAKCGEITYPDFFGFCIQVQVDANIKPGEVVHVTKHEDLFDYYGRRFMNWDWERIEAEGVERFVPEGILLFRDVSDRCVMALDRGLLDQMLRAASEYEKPVFATPLPMQGYELENHLADRMRAVKIEPIMLSACETHHPVHVTRALATWFDREGHACDEPDSEGQSRPPDEYDLALRGFADELRSLADRMNEAGVCV